MHGFYCFPKILYQNNRRQVTIFMETMCCNFLIPFYVSFVLIGGGTLLNISDNIEVFFIFHLDIICKDNL